MADLPTVFRLQDSQDVTISFASFSDELQKEAGLKDLAKKVPTVAKKLPAQGKQVLERANVTAAKIAVKFPGLYRELHDPSNYAGLPTFLKRMLGG